MRGTAEVLRCWSVTAAGAKGGLELDCDEQMERSSDGTARSGGATSRHGKGQTLDRLWLWSHRWLHSGATWPSSHLSCLPWPSVFSLLCHFLESYRINILTHSIAEERVGRAASTATTTSEACCRSETCLVSPWPTVDIFRCSSAHHLPCYGFGRIESWCDRARVAQTRRARTYTHLDPQKAPCPIIFVPKCSENRCKLHGRPFLVPPACHSQSVVWRPRKSFVV